jgi:hypothetical protein
MVRATSGSLVLTKYRTRGERRARSSTNPKGCHSNRVAVAVAAVRTPSPERVAIFDQRRFIE